MGNFSTPKPGEPVKPFIGNSALWVQLVKMLNEWQEKKAKERNESHSVCLPEAFNTDVDPVAIGEIRQMGALAQLPVDEDAQRLMKYAPRFEGDLPGWQNGMDNLMPFHRFTLPDDRSPVGAARFIPVELATAVEATDKRFLMVDPDDPNILTPAHSGIYKILGEYSDNLVNKVTIADTLQSQPLWQYVLDGEPESGSATADLYDIEGELYKTGVTVTVPFASSTPASGYCYHVGDKFYALTGDSPLAPVQVIKFRANEDIASRVLMATALNVAGSPEATYTVFPVHDPNNLFSTATMGCIGTAFFNAKRGFWEIQTCSLPANEIEVLLDEVLPAVNGTYTGTVSAEYFLRSAYPNVMRPPQCTGSCTYTWNVSPPGWQLTTPCELGCTCADAPSPPDDQELEGQTVVMPCGSEDELVIEFENPYLIDAMCDSKVVLRRISNAGWGESIESSPNINGSATAFRWEAVSASRRKARWIEFTFVSEAAAPIVTDSWNGIDPTVCGEIDIHYPLGIPCAGDKVLASYDPAADMYLAHDTRASMMGTPVTKGFVSNVANHDCGISVTKDPVQVFPINTDGVCESTPVTTDVPLGTTVPIVQSIAADGGCGFNYVKQNARVFLCGSESDVIAVQLETTDVAVLSGLSFGPPPCTNAVYTSVSDGEGGWEWEETTPCIAGCSSNPPAELPTGSGLVQEVPCIAGSGTGCGINYNTTTVKVCGISGGGGSGHALLDLMPRIVVTDVTKQPAGIQVDRETIYVCNYGGAAGHTIPTTPCPEEGGSGGA